MKEKDCQISGQFSPRLARMAAARGAVVVSGSVATQQGELKP
jgi:hypothetical protein